MKKIALDDFSKHMIEECKDHEFAAGLLTESLKENHCEKVFCFLITLRNIAISYGISRLAKKTKVNRKTLYKILSGEGRFNLNTLLSLLDALEFKVIFASKKRKSPRKKPRLKLISKKAA